MSETSELYEFEMRAEAIRAPADDGLREAYSIVSDHVVGNPDVVRAVQKLALHFSMYPVSVLLDKPEIKPEQRGVHMGVRIGLQLMVSELTDPEEIARSIEAFTPQKEK